MKHIYLIDCPGVVPPNNNDLPEDILLKGVVRIENVENPEQYIAAVLRKIKPKHIERTYDVRGFNSPTQFLELLARKGGRLLKGGEADVDGAAKMVLNDFLRGKLPWFTSPPAEEDQADSKGIEGRQGALGEMGRISGSRIVSSRAEDSELAVDDANLMVDQEVGDDFQGFDADEKSNDEMLGSSNEYASDGVTEDVGNVSAAHNVAIEAG